MIFVHELTASDVITHSVHPTGPQPGVSGRKHRWLHSPSSEAGHVIVWIQTVIGWTVVVGFVVLHAMMLE
jgi:hypothetical protein